ncbi:MAG TPA: cell division protein FtsQ/DivIB [Gammaproteobacteria bacterium]|nr:cell division protein FtsQ/DivIB [Gammaproteobacteria bacterium]
MDTPSVWRRRGLAWAAAVGVTVALAGTLAAVSWLQDPQHLPIREVRINGELRHLSPVHVQQAVLAEATGGFFSVDVDRIRAAVLGDPWVREVSVRRVWPDTLVVTVSEQHPLAYWGTAALISAEGAVFRPAPEQFPAGLPLLTGPEGAQMTLLNRYRQLQAWFAPLGLSVQQVDLNPRRSWRFTVVNEQAGGGMSVAIEVVVGRADFDARVQRLITAWPRTVGVRENDIASVDLRYTNGFAVRLRRAPPLG